MAGTLGLRIAGKQLPGATCTGPDTIFIGIQRSKEVVDAVPSRTPAPSFHAEVDLVETDDIQDYRGPFVHGPKGDRFLYLAWIDGPGGPLVARIKIRLGDIAPALIAEAVAAGQPLVGSLSLSDAQGRPRSGSVRPPEIAWAVDNADRC